MLKTQLKPEDFDYVLPENAIALHPAKRRQDARLLFYQHGRISDRSFDDIANILPVGSQLVLNDTKVIHARILAHKPSGGKLELFLLRPYDMSHEQALNSRGTSRWWCLVGGAKKWKEGPAITEHGDLRMEAFKGEREAEEFLIELRWEPEEMSFSEVLDQVGKIPLPPYIQRDVTEQDSDRYQTTFAAKEGSVAAPTAGLHFTGDLLSALDVEQVKLTLHVSAGTFRPMADGSVSDHVMHEESCEVPLKCIEQLTTDVPRFAVGTTALRTLESLYWLAVKWHRSDVCPHLVSQSDPYSLHSPFDNYSQAMNWLAINLKAKGVDRYHFHTSIMIAPSYNVQSVTGLFTNFHMPKSTLLLLVAAMVGEDWKAIYNHALTGGYRFLSYGDSSLLMP